MPSPFPGMDPYLEGSLWMTVHTQLSAELARQLAPKLRPRYLALTTERFVMEAPESVAIVSPGLYPDVGLARTHVERPPPGGTALARGPFRAATVLPTPVPHVTVEIRDTGKRRLVTAIEVLSPTNKRGDGREEYLSKRRKILVSTAHLLEIDLLRKGERVPMQEPLPAAPYFVILGRAEDRPIVDIWPIALRDQLPTVPVPLLTGDPDVTLDLQLALTNVYELLGYDLAVDYDAPLEVPLDDPEDARWVSDRAKARPR